MDYFGAMKQSKEAPKQKPSAAQQQQQEQQKRHKNGESSDSDNDGHTDETVGVDLNPDGTTKKQIAPFIGVNGDAVTPTYIKEKLLGAGAYGEAWLCRQTSTGVLSVVKLMSLPSMNRKERAYAESEVQCLAAISHPNIVEFYDSYSDGRTLYIAMEYANGGDLRKHIKSRAVKKEYLHESEALFIFIQVVLAIQFIHSKNMLHRDIKSANVLIASNGMVKLADFGFSQQYEDTVSNAVAKTFCGTPYYLAPELWRNKRYSNKAEVWSLGVFLYELLALQRPFTSPSLKSLMDEVLVGRYPPLPSRYSSEVSDLIGMLLQPDTAHRPTAFDIFRVPYVQLLTRTLIKLVNENKDIGSELKAAWIAHTESILEKAEKMPPFHGKDGPADSSVLSSGSSNAANPGASASGAPLATSDAQSSATKSQSTTGVDANATTVTSDGAQSATTIGSSIAPAKGSVTGDSDDRSAGTVDETVAHEGRVKKLSAYSKQKWSERYLRLGNGTLELEEAGKPPRKLAVESVASVTSITPAAAKRRHVFAIHTVDARCTWLQAPSESEKEKWIEKLQRSIGVM